MLEQNRINAMISYFFLGPLFLLAKKGTPLADLYVQSHAKKASKTILLTFIALTAYFFVRSYLSFAILGFSIANIVLGLIMITSILVLIRGAYSAYRGEEGMGADVAIHADLSKITQVSSLSNVESEEEKSRILASMLPYAGIYLSARYGHPLMEEGRKIGSFFTVLFAISLLFVTEESFFIFLLAALYITVFVIEAIYLFVYGRFVSWKVFGYIPSYRELESHFLASIRTLIEFLKVVFGKEKKLSYSELVARFMKVSDPVVPKTSYFMPAGLIGIPVWNIFSIPSLFLVRYREYRFLVIQGVLITLIFTLLVVFSFGDISAKILLLLFPVVHILVFASKDVMTRAPVIGLWIQLFEGYHALKESVSEAQSKKETKEYRYEVQEESSK